MVIGIAILVVIQSVVIIWQQFMIVKTNKTIVKIMGDIDDVRDSLVPLYIELYEQELQKSLDEEDYLRVSQIKKDLKALKLYAKENKLFI